MALYQKSTAKKILADKEELNRIVASTMDKMATIVGASLGPSGRPVLIERDGMAPISTKDGMTIAKSLGMDDAVENLIIESAKEICINTAKSAGDGTTSAIILANALVRNGQKFLKNNPKMNPQRLVRDLQKVYDTLVVPFLKSKSIPVETSENLINVANISANGDYEIAKIVVEAIEAAGDDGHVSIVEAQGGNMEVNTVDGYIVTSGLKELGQIGPIFINDKANQQVKMDNGVVFLYDGTINDLKVTGILQDFIENSPFQGSPLIIFAHDFADNVLEVLAKNVKGGYNIAPVKTPMSSLPNSRSIFLQDVAAYTSAAVFDPGNINEFNLEGLGNFDSARVNLYESILIGKPEKERIDNRIIELNSIMEVAKSEFDRMHVAAAISKLTGGVATILVGGASEIEIREKKDRVEDAVEAVKSAIAEGYVPGGCLMYLYISYMIKNHINYQDSWSVLSDSLEEPIYWLLSNAGENPEEIKNELLDQFKTCDIPKIVFDASQFEIVNALDRGIIEPSKVIRIVINNALSVAGVLMTIGGLVVVERQKDLENQLAIADQAFKSMMSNGNGEM